MKVIHATPDLKTVTLEFRKAGPGWYYDPNPGNFDQHATLWIAAATDKEFEERAKSLLIMCAASISREQKEAGVELTGT